MGTLFNQLPRMDHSMSVELNAIKIGKSVKEIQADLGITFNQALELYKLSYQVHNDDIKDEQLAGFGKLIQDLTEVLDINELIQDLIEVLDKE
jgi:hypothetical protein